MKKVLFILLFSIFTINLAFCSDIVIMRDSKRLEVKIVEIVDKGVRMKKLNDLDGPTYLIPKANVVTVIFENGTVKQFDETEDLILQEGDSYYNDYNAGVIVSSASNDSYNKKLGRIDKRDGFYYLGKEKMNESDYLKFIHNNCIEAWDSYQKGAQLWRTGWGLVGFSLTVIIGGTMASVVSRNENMMLVGIVVGGLGLDGATPCLIVGGIKKNRSHHVYNEVCAPSKKTAVTFGVGLSSNGIGLAMNF